MRRLFDEDYLVGSRRDGVFKVPSVFLAEGRPLPALRGTIIVLHDAGFDPDETIDWLLTPEDTIGVAPIEGVPRLEMLGLYPTVETVAAQMFALLALAWGFRRSGRARPTSGGAAVSAE